MHIRNSKFQSTRIKRSGTLFLFLITLLMFQATSCKDEKSQKTNDNKVSVAAKNSDEAEKKTNKKVIMFYGNSLTAGYRLEENESFPSRIGDIIDSLNLDYSVVNAGLSGDTSYDGLKRLDWVLNTKVDIFVLELGANDMLRGLPLKNTRENLVNIVQKVKTKYPEAQIAICAMAAAPNMGADYVTEFEKIYTDIASSETITYIPFFLDGVAGNPDLLLQDGKHPNAEGQKIAAQNIWNTIKKML